MSANSFGQLFRVTSFGESHGKALGVVVDGCPSGVSFEMDLLQRQLNRRRPGQSAIVTARNELDEAQVLSGVYEGKTLGTPIAICTYNQDQRSEDYNEIAKKPRPGHADDTWKNKYEHIDLRGGGRSSGRETVARVMAGAVAKMFVKAVYPNLEVYSYSKQIGSVSLPNKFSIENIRNNPHLLDTETRIPDVELDNEASLNLQTAKKQGKSYGGLVETYIVNSPGGLGQPVFHKFKADLAMAMLSIGATTAFDLGHGMEAVQSEGSEFHIDNNSQYGGIRGGITTGEAVSFRIGFKPTASVLDVAKKGRHDPCIVPRAVAVVEAMSWLVLADHILWLRLDNLKI